MPEEPATNDEAARLSQLGRITAKDLKIFFLSHTDLRTA
jgi:hypothetical protein